MTERCVNGVVFLTADGFTAAGGVAHGFSTREGGVSEGACLSLNLGINRGDCPDCVRENYRRFCTAIGADIAGVTMSSQVHGTTIRKVTPTCRQTDLYTPPTGEADGLITDVPGLALTIFVADCIPILLYDPVRRAAAAVHAGWRGTAGGIAGKAVRRLQEEYGCRPDDILAAIGPGISACCFETHGDVPEALASALGREIVVPWVRALAGGKFLVDLKGLNAMELERAGVARAHIETAGDCTACLPQKYWSHRVTCGVRGSQAAMIQLL